MFKAQTLIPSSVRRSLAGLAFSSLVLVAALSADDAIAQDNAAKAVPAADVFSKIMEDLNQIKEVAFSKPFLEFADTAAECCGSCSMDESDTAIHSTVCPHLAHPGSCPLAYSHDVRSSDVIPPVPNIEDYATPDDEETFVDEDMINKLQDDKVSMEQGIGNYCGQMAKLLSDTLQSPSLNSDQKTAAIESAMQLAVVNAQIAAEAKIAQMKAAHESELAVMRGRLLQYSYIESNQHKLYQWLSPIYSNVNRNFQQIQKMAENSAQLNRGVSNLQSQLANQRWNRTNTVGATEGTNQLIVTRRSEPVAQPVAQPASTDRVPAAHVSVARVPASTPASRRASYSIAGHAPQNEPISLMDFQILEQRLQNAERLIDRLTSRLEPADQSSVIANDRPAPTHRRVSYDGLTPIKPLNPQR